MNSSIAFVSQDWDDFEQEMLSGNLPRLMSKFEGNLQIKSPTESNVYETQFDSKAVRDPLNVLGSCAETQYNYGISEENIGLDDNQDLDGHESGKSKSKLVPLSDTIANQPCSPSTEEHVDKEDIFFKEKISSHDSSSSVDLVEDHSASIKQENLDFNESCNDIVNEMEEILLDSFESPRIGFFQDNAINNSHPTHVARDGGSTASASTTNDPLSLSQHPLKIDGIEVIGARQKKGDVSLGERLVGVKEYTVYIIKVWSGQNHWEVERRYRDFLTLFRRLKSVFTDQGLSLPSPWYTVEKESRKIFGNAAPDVINERSLLIQECLRSILHSNFLSSPPTALILFLSLQTDFSNSPTFNSRSLWSTYLTRGVDTENISGMGKTISLIVEIRPYKSTRQLLEAQNYTCAGCHRNFDDGNTLMQDFVKSLGWGKPRLCEYTGQLFCSSCHTNETAILPARVLHHWDFIPYPISQMAKSYLDSIHDQPMLCVSAVNPFLFSKVPAMLHIMNIRKKVGTMIPYVRCPFRRSINNALGSRRYLLEGNDFFALRDLIDLSKGAFAALPVMIETVSKKIQVHITEQCLICCDVGVPCGARQACNDPSSLIFAFQEGEIEKCKSCESVFHQRCYGNIKNCPCGFQLRMDEAIEEDGALDSMVRKLGSGLNVGFLSGLFSSKSRQENNFDDSVILMGSLPNTSL